MALMTSWVTSARAEDGTWGAWDLMQKLWAVRAVSDDCEASTDV